MADPFPIEHAPAEGRELLGALLAQRRKELGYTHWPAFARDRLPLTPQGNPNTRLLADIEKAYRKRFPEPTLRQLARAYQVDYRSLTDVAHLRAGALVPAPPASAPAGPAGLPAAAPPAAGQDGWQPPIADKARRDADAPYAAPILDRLLELADAGVTDPDGAQMFGEGTADARAWDGHGAWVRAPRDRAWFIADIRRLEAGRAGNSGTGATGA
jgi:hypothetical protein